VGLLTAAYAIPGRVLLIIREGFLFMLLMKPITYSHGRGAFEAVAGQPGGVSDDRTARGEEQE
jgi:hypothetical protein